LFFVCLTAIRVLQDIFNFAIHVSNFVNRQR
jgi:hypothetical protein